MIILSIAHYIVAHIMHIETLLRVHVFLFFVKKKKKKKKSTFPI